MSSAVSAMVIDRNTAHLPPFKKADASHQKKPGQFALAKSFCPMTQAVKSEKSRLAKIPKCFINAGVKEY